MKNFGSTSTMITAITVFIGVGIVVFIAENLGIHSWPETMLAALSGLVFAIIGSYIYKVSSKTKNR